MLPIIVGVIAVLAAAGYAGYYALAKLMESAGYPRESAKSLEAYNRGCTFSEDMLQFAYSAYTRIGDHKAAINVANELVKYDPAMIEP